jgi:glycosyltransferase involved in cell wall biosynthesis
MKVSALIPTYNRRAYIRRSIDSVLAQTVPVDEIIVIDDVRSTDSIEKALEEWYGARVRVVKHGGGLSGARRRGVQEAQGQWIAFLDSDDEWALDRNRELLDAADRVPSDVAWIFGDLRVVTDRGEGTSLFEEFGLTVKDSPHVFTDTLSVHYPFQFGLLQGSFIRRSVLMELDCFNEGLQHSEDLLAGFQVADRYRFAAVPSVVGRYFRTSDLAANSALLKGLYGPDYYRARMLAFALVIESGKRKTWNMRYAAEVRGLCRVRASQEREITGLAMQQFRYGGISAKGIAFFGAAMFGRRGVKAWNAIAQFRRNQLGPENTKILRKNSFRGYMQSVVGKNYLR